MADNVDLTSPAGSALADEVTDGTLGTAKAQYIKIMDGTIDGTTKAAVDANGLAVKAVGAAAENAAVAGNPVLTGGRYDSSDRTLDNGDAGAIALTSRAHVKTVIYDSSGAVVDPVSASTIFRSIDVDETEDEVSNSAATLHWMNVVNTTASVLYLKLYNAAAASVTVGTTTPVMTFVVPTLGDTNGCGFNIEFGSAGVSFDTGLCVAATTALADSDTGAPGANACIVNLGYS